MLANGKLLLDVYSDERATISLRSGTAHYRPTAFIQRPFDARFEVAGHQLFLQRFIRSQWWLALSVQDRLLLKKQTQFGLVQRGVRESLCHIG